MYFMRGDIVQPIDPRNAWWTDRNIGNAERIRDLGAGCCVMITTGALFQRVTTVDGAIIPFLLVFLRLLFKLRLRPDEGASRVPNIE